MVTHILTWIWMLRIIADRGSAALPTASQKLATVVALTASIGFVPQSHALDLIDADFLRVAVSCPQTLDQGRLETVDQNRLGAQGRSITTFLDGKLDEILILISDDGKNFTTDFLTTRKLSQEKGEMWLFVAFEKQAEELLRFYCFADPDAKNAYDEAIKFNREMLSANQP